MIGAPGGMQVFLRGPRSCQLPGSPFQALFQGPVEDPPALNTGWSDILEANVLPAQVRKGARHRRNPVHAAHHVFMPKRFYPTLHIATPRTPAGWYSSLGLDLFPLCERLPWILYRCGHALMLGRWDKLQSAVMKKTVPSRKLN